MIRSTRGTTSGGGDATTLDGLDSTGFVQTTGNQTVTGLKTIQVTEPSTSVFDRVGDLVIQNTSATDGNWSAVGFESADGTLAAGIACVVVDQATDTGRMMFLTRQGGVLSSKLAVDDAVHVANATFDTHALNRVTADARYQPIGVTAPALVHPLVGAITSAGAWPAANSARLIRFTLPVAGTFRYMRHAIGAQSGNIQVGVVQLTGAALTDYTRVMDSGVIACPAVANQHTHDLGATVLPAGDYALFVWADNTTFQTAVVISNASGMAGTGIGGAFTNAAGVPASGTGLAWTSGGVPLVSLGRV